MGQLLIRLSRLFFRVGSVLIPILARVIGFVLRLILAAIVSLIIGIPIAIHRIADDETERAIKGGLPTIYAHYCYLAVQILATVAIAIGWIGFAFSTVFIITLLF